MGTYWWIRVGGEHGVSFFDGERWRFLGRNISGTVTDCGRPKKHKITQLELWSFMKNSFGPTQSHHHYHSWWHGHWSGRWHVTMRHLFTKDSEPMPKDTHGSMHSSTGQKCKAHQTWSLVNHINCNSRSWSPPDRKWPKFPTWPWSIHRTQKVTFPPMSERMPHSFSPSLRILVLLSRSLFNSWTACTVEQKQGFKGQLGHRNHDNTLLVTCSTCGQLAEWNKNRVSRDNLVIAIMTTHCWLHVQLVDSSQSGTKTGFQGTTWSSQSWQHIAGYMFNSWTACRVEQKQGFKEQLGHCNHVMTTQCCLHEHWTFPTPQL